MQSLEKIHVGSNGLNNVESDLHTYPNNTDLANLMMQSYPLIISHRFNIININKSGK